MQVIEGVSGAEEVANLGLLLGFLEAELAANHNFEFTQALLRITLQVCMLSLYFTVLSVP